MMSSPGTIRTVAAIALSPPLIACNSSSFEPGLTTLAAPKAVATLINQSNLTVRFSVSINSIELLKDMPPGEKETSLSLGSNNFRAGINTISITFYAYDNTNTEFILAQAEQQITFTSPDDPIVLSGLSYRYTDTDGDNRFDVHELGVSPADIDDDGIPNIYDTDSDGDDISDGMDTTPYGIATLAISQTPSFELKYEDNSTATVYVNRFEGVADEVIQLLNTLPSVDFRSPPLWPASQWAAANQQRGVTSFELGIGENNLCPDLRISIDTSSIRSNLSQPALLYFRKLDRTPFVASLGAAEIADLNQIDNPQQTEDSEWNDSMRIILVPEGTVGWIELWTDSFFTGEVCRINLTTNS